MTWSENAFRGACRPERVHQQNLYMAKSGMFIIDQRLLCLILRRDAHQASILYKFSPFVASDANIYTDTNLNSI